MELTKKTVLVVGAGISGVSATKLLATLECNVILMEGNVNRNKEEILSQLTGINSVNVILGEPDENLIALVDCVVVSPGVPVDTPFITQFSKNKIPVIGEIELASFFEQGRIIAITGTNGKTTTTALVGHIMKHYYQEVLVVGNIGMPYTMEVMKTTKDSVTVVEVSSFQLETINEFCPQVSAILNITPDHLNRHHTMEQYFQAKLNVTKNQRAAQTCVLNYEDEWLRGLYNKLQCNVVYFSSKQPLTDGYYLDGKDICIASKGQSHKLLNVEELLILGLHNYENVMAAIAMATALGVPMETIIKAVKTFTAVEHRIEYVAEIDGVKYYNDSKGTNPDAAIKAIQAMTGPTVLIGGGYDKDSTYDEWIESFDGKVKKLLLLGQTREKIAECARNHGFNDYQFVDTLEEAVEIAAAIAVPFDSVLLSPACASWGMFKNFEERGQLFKQYVKALSR